MKRTVLCAAVAALLPAVAFADLNYTKLDVSFVNVELDGPFDVDGDGFAVGGSFELNDRFHVFGEWQDLDYDLGSDERAIEIGAGYRHGLTDTLDFVGTLSYIDVDFGAGDTDALGLGAGIRARVGRSFEVDAALKYVDFDEGGDDTSVLLGGRWYFNDSMAVGLSTHLNDDAGDALRVGFRWEF
jgi:hypothetical protein